MPRRYEIHLSKEVASWYQKLATRDRAFADRAFDRLEELGPQLRMPHSRAIGKGVFELRFNCEQVARRVTYVFESESNIITLTTFRKQRDTEPNQLARAYRTADRLRGDAP
jgi:phage-related protein